MRGGLRGFTLTELVVVIAIITVVVAAAVGALGNYRARASLDGAVEHIAAQLYEARSRALSSENAQQYGVHFEADAAVLFEGTMYSASDPGNRRAAIDPPARIATTTLQGGGSDVVFNRLTGATGNDGTLTIELSTTGETRTVTIQQTGLVTIQ